MSGLPNAYRYDEKIIHVGTPGIFHRLLSLAQTRCLRDATDCRATAHDLADYQPCHVCFEGWDCSLPGDCGETCA